jgi:hypothetical protein
LIYTLGADEEVGGSGRDADVVCASVFSHDEADTEPCGCAVGDVASALLK